MNLDEAILELEFHLDFLIDEIQADIEADDDEASDVTKENRKYAKALGVVIAAVKKMTGGDA